MAAAATPVSLKSKVDACIALKAHGINVSPKPLLKNKIWCLRFSLSRKRGKPDKYHYYKLGGDINEFQDTVPNETEFLEASRAAFEELRPAVKIRPLRPRPDLEKRNMFPTVFADDPSPAKLLTPPSLRENHQLDLYLQTLEDGPLKTLMRKKVDEDDTVGHRRQSFWQYKQWAENELSRVEKHELKREQWQCYVNSIT